MADPIFKELAYLSLAQTAQNPNKDFIRATPRNPVLGFLSDLVAKSYAPQRTQQMQGVAEFLGAPSISKTLDRLSYGEPLTTGAGGIAGTLRIRPEALDTAMMVAPLVGPAARMTRGLPIGMSVKNVGKKTDDELVRIYRGSFEDKNKPFDVVSNYAGDDIFGGVFGSQSKSAAQSHGSGAVHFTDIPKSQILENYDLNYNIPYDKTKSALLKARPDLKDKPDEFDKVYDLVVEDKNLFKFDEDEMLKLFNTSDLGEAAWEKQRLRGQVAKNLGYKAVEMDDEHGTSYLVTPGAKFYPDIEE